MLARALGERQTVGIDIGHYSVKMVRMLHTHKGEHIVLSADLEPLPEGVIVDCTIQDSEKLQEAISKIFARNMIEEDVVEYVASINGASGVLVDLMSSKVPKNANEDAFLLQMAQTKPPFDDPDNVLDYHILSRNADEVSIAVVAVKNAQLEDTATFFDRVGKKLSAIDVSTFALSNAYCATVLPEEREKSVVVFNIGEKKMDAVYLLNGNFHSYRTMTSGALDSVISMLTKHLNIDAEKCHTIFELGDTSCVDGFSEAEVEEALKISYEEIVSAVEFGIRFFSTQDNAENPEKIFLGGGGACLPNLASYLTERLGLSVETVNPFRNVTCDSAVVGESGMSLSLSNIYAPALGLAMRKF